MKNMILSLALLATVSTVSLAGDKKGDKAKPMVKAKAKTECATGASHACCMKRTNV